jgi:4-carboxymuconolactone decarboxylase
VSNEEKYDPKALKRAGELFGEEYIKASLDQFNEIDQEWSLLFQRYVYGGCYDRNVLSQKVRELCAVSGLTVGYAPHMLKGHIKAALRMGATKEEVAEAIIQMSVYGGFPNVIQALRGPYREAVEEAEAGQTGFSKDVLR